MENSGTSFKLEGFSESQIPGPIPALHKLAHLIYPVTNMSSASMATASVETDLTLDGDTKIGNQICIPVATQGDGTPLCPSLLNIEEDAVELCIGLGQEHPEGVLLALRY